MFIKHPEKKRGMKAVRKLEAKPGFSLADIPEPSPGKGELLIDVQATSMCGTDIHIYNWEPPWSEGNRFVPPKTMGHEVAGKVIQVGKAVEGFQEGDLVSAESHIWDGTCPMCLMKNYHICQNVKFFSIDTDGFWAEKAIIPQQNAWKNPASLPAEIATLQESMGNSVYTVSESNVQGKNVAIFGAGPTGLFATGIAKAMGALKVMTVAGSDTHKTIAKQMGADLIIDRHKENPVDVIKSETNGIGADVVLEMSGSVKGFETAIKSVRMTGMLTMLGLPIKKIEIDVSKDIVLKDLTFRGVYGRKVWDTWKMTSDLLTSGKVDISPIITHRLKLEDFEKGIEAMKSGQSGKVVFTP